MRVGIGQEAWHIAGIVLAIGIDLQSMGSALRRRVTQAGDHCRAFAAVLWQTQQPDLARVLCGQIAQHGGADRTGAVVHQ